MQAYHAIDSLAREDEQLLRNACSPVLLQDDWQIAAHRVCRPSVPGIVIRGLVAGKDIHKTLLLGTPEHSWGVGLGDVCVQRVRIELCQDIPAEGQPLSRQLALMCYFQRQTGNGKSASHPRHAQSMVSEYSREWAHILLIPEFMQLLMGMSMSCMFDPAHTLIHLSCPPSMLFSPPTRRPSA